MLEPAELVWRGNRPYARAYDDIYYTGDGVDEVDRVFLRPTAFAEHVAGQPLTTVAELGFGSGLNFAVAARTALAHPHARLHFISIEKHPLRAQDWRRVADARRAEFAAYAELAPLPLLPGWHRRTLAGGRVTLSVFHGEVAAGIGELAERQRHPVDIWLLDGFAPARNPDMWRPALFASMARCSRRGAAVATFTAAGSVRRGLEAAGFAMRKVDQRPHKRESLAGELARGGAGPMVTPDAVTVYGAGIAGCSVARCIADQGVRVSLYDPNGVASGASRMSTTVLHGRLLGDGSPTAEFRAAAYHHALSFFAGRSAFAQTGALQIQGPTLNEQKLERILRAYPGGGDWLRRLPPAEASDLAGVDIHGDALWFPHAGVVDLPTACRDLVDHPLIEQVGTEPQRAGPAVLAAATGTRGFPGCEHLEIADVHGQLDWVEAARMPRIPIVGNGYAVPLGNTCVLGASYEYSEWETGAATRHNLELNAHLCQDAKPHRLMRAARAATSDRVPVVGAAAENTWISAGHGSLGTTTAPIAAAMIASALLGWVPPVSHAVERLLDPGRFAARQARRGVRHIRPL